MNSTEISAAWISVTEGPLYVLRCSDGYLIEEPDPDYDTCEGSLRIFTEWLQAMHYLEHAQPFFEERLEIVTLTLVQLFDQLNEIETQAIQKYGCPAGFVISTIREKDSWAESIDLLWSAFYSTPETWN